MTATEDIREEGSRKRLTYLAPKVTTASYSRAYTRFVRASKVTLPLAAVALLATALMWPAFRDRLVEFVGFVPAAIDEAIEDFQVIKMTMRGLDEGDQPYSFTAETAIKYDPDIEEIDLLNPTADISMSDGSWLAVMSERGLYNSDEETLLLLDNVNMFHDQGYEMNTNSALIDFSTGDMVGREPTHGHGDFGELEGKSGFEVSNDGDRVLLLGPARLVIYPEMAEPQ